MTLTLPLFAQDAQYSAELMRLLQLSHVEEGVISPGDMLVSGDIASLSITIDPGIAYVRQTVSQVETDMFYRDAYGIYFVGNDDVASPFNSVTAPITNPRIDRVVVRVYDVTEQGVGGQSFARFEWVIGAETAGATLTNLLGVAAEPDNSLTLAYFLHLPGQTSNPSFINVQAPAARYEWTSQIIKAATSLTAVHGTFYVVDTTGNVTIGLPTPFNGTRVGVIKHFTTGTVTIDGTPVNVYAPGVTTSTFNITAQGVAYQFLADGASWNAISN